MSTSDDAVRIHILDKEYLVACTAEQQDALLASAKSLNDKMVDIRESGKVVGIDRIAVMTALNMAHEIIESGARDDSELESCSDRIRQLNSRIGAALDKFKLAGLN